MRIALVYNLREQHPGLGSTATDAYADWDLAEPMAEVRDALEGLGHTVLDVGDPRALLDGADVGGDLVFNLAEMTGFRFREALVPALLELHGIPYTFAPPDTMVLTLDKNVSNLLVRQAGGPVADWLIADAEDDPRLLAALDAAPGVRWFVKPVAEGSSMGIPLQALCDTPDTVRAQVASVVATYGQPALVQHFLAGREFTVGILERNGRPWVLDPIEVGLRPRTGGALFDFESKEALGAEVVACLPVDPAEPVHAAARSIAELAFTALGCRDAARVDVRCASGASGMSFMEINALPGLDPLSAETFALPYPEILDTILKSAASRWGLGAPLQESDP